MSMERSRIFLLSPAYSGGARAQTILNDQAGFALAVRLRAEGAPIGEIYSFVSGLYFRGKMAYAGAFASPPPDLAGAMVITPGSGLLPVDTTLTAEQLRQIGRIPVDCEDPLYREPLSRDAQTLAQRAGPHCEFVLLGSVATDKYVGPLLDVFGDRLLFPAEFVGRGDMSRGGLMLRCARAGTPLTHIPVEGAVRRGSRPPKLPKP